MIAQCSAEKFVPQVEEGAEHVELWSEYMDLMLTAIVVVTAVVCMRDQRQPAVEAELELWPEAEGSMIVTRD